MGVTAKHEQSIYSQVGALQRVQVRVHPINFI